MQSRFVKRLPLTPAPAYANKQVAKVVANPPRLWGWLRNQSLMWCVPLLLVVAWQVLASLGILSTRILPAPASVAKTGVQLFTTGHLLDDIAISAQRAFSGFAIGATIGLSLGFLNGFFSLSEKLLDSSIQMVRNVPHLSLIPLVILWFGIGEEAKLFLVALGVFFPVYLNTFHGVRNVDAGLLEMGKVYKLSAWEQFWHIILPGALPSILVGIRYALGIMWLTLIVAETIAANSGIGYITMNAREFMQTDVMVVGILIYALLGKLADTVAKLFERRLLKWQPRYQQP
jgi:sulfonate transport system permease protein